MDDLLKNSLRMRPDRIIVGEVRGPEAQTLFVAMDTGHEGCMGTLHSNSARELLTRLREKPMSVPDSMLPLLNLILVQYRIYDKKKGAMRRVAQVAELSRMDEKVLLSNVFEWNRKTDKIERTAIPSNILEMLSNATGMTKNELKQEMVLRQRVLDWMLKKGIKDNLEVEKVIQRYYVDPETILKEVLKEV
jgi:flagellar protein FlaI